MKTGVWLVVAALGLPAARAAEIQVAIDVLPGEARNLIDPAAPDAVPVAILASAELDAASVDPASLRLMGAPTVKNEAGADHELRDVDGDGRLDLLVWFAAREIRIAEGDTSVTLEGATRDGLSLAGRDAARTLDAARRAEGPRLSLSAGRLPPVTAEVEILPGGAIAVLASDRLDPRAVVLDSIRIGGRPTGKTQDGGVASYTDVNGDGRIDLVVTSRDPGAEGTAFGAVLADGSSVGGTPTGSVVRPPVELLPAEPTDPDEVRNQYPGVITIGDGAASPYPATITVSGVSGTISKLRVTLNGIAHECLRDLDVMLVGPTGQSLMLLSDAGGCTFDQLTLTFDDFAPTTVLIGAPPVTNRSYKPTNGGPLPGDPLPAPAPVPSQASTLSAFNGTNPNGDWKLYVVDDTQSLVGAIQGGWTLDIITAVQICTPPTPALIPAGAPGTTAGPAENYGSWVFASGLPPRLSKVSVTLKGLTHARPDDLDVLLVSPSGGKVLLMASAGGTGPISDTDLTFDDTSTIAIADVGGIWGSATYRPSVFASPAFFAPAPGPPYPDTLRSLLSWDPNGTWRVYVQDHTTGAGSTGVLAEGWCLNVTTIAASDSCQLQTITIPQGAPATTAGPAVPYPSTLEVTGTTGRIETWQLKLLGLTHTYPDDLDVLLQAPSGKSIWLMSDAGGSGDVSGLDVTFDPFAFDVVPDATMGPGPHAPNGNYEAVGDNMPAPAPGTATDTSLYEELPNGTWKLWVNDDAGSDVGSIAGWCLNFRLFEPYASHCSPGGNFLTIPSFTGQTSGPAGPYPWNAQVTEQGTTIGRLVVRVWDLEHTYPDDLDILIAGPTGMKILLMSDAGGGGNISGLDLEFDDYATSAIPDDGQLVSGRTQPVDYNGGDTDAFPAPAPAGPYGTNLSAFNGTDPRGTWGLFVNDDAGADVGSAMQWCIDVYPNFPPGEVTNVRWKDKTTLEWDAAPNAWSYGIRRGVQVDLPKLLTAETDSCDGWGVYTQTVQQVAVPAPGSFYWYMVLGSLGAGLPIGTAGTASIGGAATARILDSTAGCSP